jgi:predicted Zn-dependent protease
MKGSMAVGQTTMLAFTRENETEADEKGIMFLKKSCFAPEGLLSGLMKIRELDFQGAEGIPDYVKTHPGTGERIAHVETILSGYTPLEDKVNCEDFRFDMIKYRLLGHYADIKYSFNQLTAQLKADSPNSNNAALHYGLGLVYARKSMREKSISHLKKALSINILDPMILLELGRVYIINGEYEKALDALNGIESDPVIGLMAKFHQATAHLELRNLSKARDLFNEILNKAPEIYPKAYYNMANIMALEKKSGLSHYYLGFYYSETGNRKTALIHLNKALGDLKDEIYIKKAKKLMKKLQQKKSGDKPREKGLSYRIKS